MADHVQYYLLILLRPSILESSLRLASAMFTSRELGFIALVAVTNVENSIIPHHGRSAEVNKLNNIEDSSMNASSDVNQ